ncbi:MAG: hypothetical protein ACR2LM_09260 [Pyrinomonadaceae bacterium]
MANKRIRTMSLLCLAAIALWPPCDASAQRRRQPKSTATLTVKASVYYQLGGNQPIPPTEFLIQDKDPEELLSFVGEASGSASGAVITYAVAKVFGESFEIARMRILIAQERDEYMREQVEQELNSMRGLERLRAENAFNRNERYVPDKETYLKASATIINNTITRAVTDNSGVAVFRGLPAGRKAYLLGIAPTRGGVVVWLFSFTLRPGSNETLVLNQTNALLAF